MAIRQELESEKKGKSKGADSQRGKKSRDKRWEKPALEEVSDKVMAQPYIRFT